MRCSLSLLPLLPLFSFIRLSRGGKAPPPLGWNTWKTCGDPACTHDYCDYYEIMSTASAMIDNGLLELGYNYIVLDDCWAHHRTPSGLLMWDESRFPNGGIPEMIDELHGMNFKVGLYTSAGNETCSNGGREGLVVPGSENYYDQDVETFNDWGVDYIKLDFCGNVKDLEYGLKHGREYHELFGELVRNSTRDIFLETVAGYWFLRDEVYRYSDAWRFCEDHHDDWESTNEALLCRHALTDKTTNTPSGYPYMDFLMTGGAGCSPYSQNTNDHCPKQTFSQYTTEYSLWSLTQSPLFIATDLRVLTPIMKTLLFNDEIIAYHQNTLYDSGSLIKTVTEGDGMGGQVWGRRMGDKWLVCLVNRFSQNYISVTVNWSDLQWEKIQTAKIRDLWKQSDIDGVFTESWNTHVEPGGTVYIVLTKV